MEFTFIFPISVLKWNQNGLFSHDCFNLHVMIVNNRKSCAFFANAKRAEIATWRNSLRAKSWECNGHANPASEHMFA